MIERLLIPPSIHLVEQDLEVKARNLYDLVSDGLVKRVHIVAWRDLDDKNAGGSELHAHEIASRWANAGLDVTLRTGAVDGRPEEIVRNGYKVVRRSGRYLTFPRTMLSGMAGRSGNWDVLVEIWNGMPFLTPLWSKGPRVVILHHVHQKVLWRSVLPPGLASIGATFEKKIAPKFYRSTKVITPSQSSASEIIDMLKWPEDQVNVVMPGIADRFRPGGKKTEFPSVMALGRLVPPKRYEWLIESFKDVIQQLPNAQLFIAGDGPHREVLEKLILQLKLDKSVKLLGRVSDDEVVRLYRSCWLVASASEREGWGMTLTEAAACGTPAIATKIAGHIDAVVNGMSGILVSSQRELKDSIIDVLKNEDLRKRLSIGALRHAARLTWDVAATSAFQVVRSAVKEYNRLGSRSFVVDFQEENLERRGSERFDLDVPFFLGTDTGRLLDMSMTGALILPPEGYDILPGDEVAGKLDTSKQKVFLEGRAVRKVDLNDESQGVGIWLTDISDGARELLAVAKFQKLAKMNEGS